MADGEARARRRVLLVDDNADIRLLLRMIIDREPHLIVVGEAADGAAAVEEARALQPDLTVLDLSMPVMDGLTALPLVKAAAPNCQVVMFSAVPALHAEAAARAAGASAYVEKGSWIRGLLATLSSLVI